MIAKTKKGVQYFKSKPSMSKAKTHADWQPAQTAVNPTTLRECETEYSSALANGVKPKVFSRQIHALDEGKSMGWTGQIHAFERSFAIKKVAKEEPEWSSYPIR